ncbi:uncharacterized protein STEHIDRAFT_149882 [Stereum hirsutum FP-91666 SS1]|uniref:uncharacterized protein n=1 Tax=Stereum hirsutum (strain FP-91666) TaxID=721885 RepID=UPI000444A380|nr:uncharacterized protein STEHIDRAFT_149882 [Stereum hirsutum FP-91666 SS1]EIM81454.1 hypothetical protein STEHIDRAFT_149882 [Stereum hirsutum FP-91666 SS1]
MSTAVSLGTTTIDSTIGALVVGWGVSMLPYGMLCIQVYYYFQRYPKDTLALKLLVVTLTVLETVHQALVGHCIYFYSVTSYGKPLVLLGKPEWSLSIQVIIGALVGAIVKLCFGLRVWKFSKGNWFVTGVIMLLALSQLGFATAYTYKSFTTNLIMISALKTIATTSLALGVGTDVFTAAALSYFLHKMRTGYAKSDGLINRLILYSVNNGFFTSICSLTVLILYNIMPGNFIFMAFYFILCKLYANSCLATLNTRRFVRGKGTDREEVTGPSFVMVHHTITSHTSGGPITPGSGRSRGEVYQMKPTAKGAISGPLTMDVRVNREQTGAADPVPRYDEYATGW